jgi:hypothetical protein
MRANASPARSAAPRNRIPGFVRVAVRLRVVAPSRDDSPGKPGGGNLCFAASGARVRRLALYPRVTGWKMTARCAPRDT